MHKRKSYGHQHPAAGSGVTLGEVRRVKKPRPGGGAVDVGGGQSEAGEGKHTILLIQPLKNKATRTYLDYETVTAAMDGICNLYEKKLRELNPTVRSLTYGIDDLYKFLDDMEDISALVYDPRIQAYRPYPKDWIQKRCFTHLKRQAT